MIDIIKRWFGKEHKTLDSSGLEPPRRPSSATAAVLANGRHRRKGPPEPSGQSGPRPTKPTLSLDIGSDEPPQEPSDPYNTGRFDRSTLWEHISRSQR